MTSEVAKLTYRAVIDYLGGHTEQFNDLVSQAMALTGKEACACGGEVIRCRYRKRNAKVCTSCGTVYQDDKKILRGVEQ